jgi:hypothetical protein
LAVVREAGGAVGHHAFSLRGTDGDAKVRLPRLAEETFATLSGVQRNDVVARLDRDDAFANFNNDACSFMTENRGE